MPDIQDLMFNKDASTPEQRKILMRSEMWPVVAKVFNHLCENSQPKIDEIITTPKMCALDCAITLSVEFVNAWGLHLARVVKRESTTNPQNKSYALEIGFRSDQFTGRHEFQLLEEKTDTLLKRLTKKSTFTDRLIRSANEARLFPVTMFHSFLGTYCNNNMGSTTGHMPTIEGYHNTLEVSQLMELAFGGATLEMFDSDARDKWQRKYKAQSQNLTRFREGQNKLLKLFSCDKWLIGFGRARADSPNKPVIVASLNSSDLMKMLNPINMPSSKPLFSGSTVELGVQNFSAQYYEDMEYFREKHPDDCASINAAMAMFAINRGLENRIYDVNNYRSANLPTAAIWNEVNVAAFSSGIDFMAWVMLDKY